MEKESIESLGNIHGRGRKEVNGSSDYETFQTIKRCGLSSKEVKLARRGSRGSKKGTHPKKRPVKRPTKLSGMN